MTRKDMIEARDSLAKSVWEMFRMMRATGNIPAQQAGGAMLMLSMHEMFCRQLDQAFFEPVNTVAEEKVINAIHLLQAIRQGEEWVNLEVDTCIDSLKKILPKEPTSTDIRPDTMG